MGQWVMGQMGHIFLLDGSYGSWVDGRDPLIHHALVLVHDLKCSQKFGALNSRGTWGWLSHGADTATAIFYLTYTFLSKEL
jgi:hypothetical protein